MITAKLNGGLGNQLFQIAAAYSLALDNGDTCAFDLSAPVVKQGNSAINYHNNILRKVDILPLGWEAKSVYKEPSLDYFPIPYCEGMCLDGYFQSDKYFRKKDMIDLFIDKDTIENIKGDFINTLAIHIRRGDYIGDSLNKILPMDYYRRAILYIEKHADIKRILIFSDDIVWCSKKIYNEKMVFMSSYPDYIDLYTMMLCPYKIIANSSFSAWASILGENKIVIAPLQWSQKMKTKDVYTKEMIVI